MTNDANINEPAHSGLGASVQERRFNCSGSYNFEKASGFISSPSYYSAEGTVAHSLASEYLINGTRPKFGFVEQDGFNIEITEEMLDAVEVYTDYIEDLQRKYRLPDSYIGIEKRISIPGDAAHEEMFGTADAIIHVPYDRIIVVDYKHGAGKRVSVVNNKQLLYYALGAWYAMDESDREEIERVEMVIVQPRCAAIGSNGIDSYFVHTDALMEFERELRQVVDAAHEPDAPLTPGDWCGDTFCPMISRCPALKDKVQSTVGAKFMEVSVKAPGGLPNPKALTGEQKALILDNAAAVKSFIKAVEDEALNDEIKSPGSIPRYKVVEGIGNRQYVAEAEAQIKDALYDLLVAENAQWADDLLRELVYTEPKMRTPAKLETALKKAKVPLDLAQFTIRPATARKLVPVSDLRDEKSAIQAFIDV